MPAEGPTIYRPTPTGSWVDSRKTRLSQIPGMLECPPSDTHNGGKPSQSASQPPGSSSSGDVVTRGAWLSQPGSRGNAPTNPRCHSTCYDTEGWWERCPDYRADSAKPRVSLRHRNCLNRAADWLTGWVFHHYGCHLVDTQASLGSGSNAFFLNQPNSPSELAYI